METLAYRGANPWILRCSFHSIGNCFVSIVSDSPLGSSPIRIDSTMSGARNVSRSNRAANWTEPLQSGRARPHGCPGGENFSLSSAVLYACRVE